MYQVRKETPEEYDHYFDIINSCSANDCTGLIPAGLVSEEELAVYQEIYHFGPPVNEVDATKQKEAQ